MAVTVPKTDAQIAALAPVQSVAGMTGTVSLTYEDIVGIGSMAVQNASSVSISGGTITDITDLAIADGGTGASNAADARTNLGLVIGTDVLSPTGSGASLTDISQSQVSGLDTSLSTKADLVDGVIPSSQIPSVAITEFLGSVASEAAMTALNGQKGDWCIRTDAQMAYFIVGDDPTLAANWTAIPHPSSPVLTVNGQTGAVVLGYADVGAQVADATLTGLASVTTAADKLIYASGSDAFTTCDFTATARSLLDDTSTSAMRTTLGLGTIATQASSSVTITGGSVTNITDLLVADGGTGSSTASGARTNLGLVIGTDVLAPSGSGASLTGITATQIGLGSVTNDAQTKASIVPNTVPAAGRLLVGNAGGTAYGVVAASGDATISSTGAITVSTVGGVSVQPASGNLTATITTNTPTTLAAGVVMSNGSDIDVLANTTTNRVLAFTTGTGFHWGPVQQGMLAGNSILNSNINSAANIDATKLGTGAVDNTKFNYLSSGTEDIQTRLNSLKVETTGIHDTAPVVGVIYLDQKAQVARTINGLYGLKTTSGTCTLSVKINGTAVTGLSALSVTSTSQDAVATAANTVASGDIVTLEYTAVSSPVDMRATLKATRT